MQQLESRPLNGKPRVGGGEISVTGKRHDWDISGFCLACDRHEVDLCNSSLPKTLGFYRASLIIRIVPSHHVTRADGLGRSHRLPLPSKPVGHFGEDTVCLGRAAIYGPFNLCSGEALTRFVFTDRPKIGRSSM